MQADRVAEGVIVVVFVNVAPNVTTLVVVAQPSLKFVFVGVGSVVVRVSRPERTVGGGRVDWIDAVARTVSVVVIGAAV